MSARAALAAACLTVAASLAAQPPQSGGPLLAAPAAVVPGPGTTDLNGNPLGRETIQTKKPGFSPVRKLSWPAGSPDFSRVFPVATLEVDAMSLGEDQIASDCAGRVTVPPGAWNSMLFAVDPQTRGAPGSTIAREVSAGGSASADVFSYVFPGSVLPAGVGDTERALDSTELGLRGAPGPGEIAALDSFIPLYQLPVLRTALTRTPTVYFSLTAASAATVLQWFGSGRPSGATILRTTWGGTSWSPPAPFLTHDDLGLPSTEEVDAFAYDRVRNMVLFSTEKAPVEQQLKILCLGVDFPAGVDYEEPGGKKVTVQAGVGTGGNVTGVCTIDPARNPSVTYPSFTWGTAGPPLPLPFPTDLGAAVYRTSGPPGRDAYHSVMIGWPGGSPRAGDAYLLLRLGASWFSFGPFKRDPANPIAGDPIEFPPVLTLAALHGVDMTGVWIAVDAGFTVASLSHPIVIRL